MIFGTLLQIAQLVYHLTKSTYSFHLNHRLPSEWKMNTLKEILQWTVLRFSFCWSTIFRHMMIFNLLPVHSTQDTWQTPKWQGPKWCYSDLQWEQHITCILELSDSRALSAQSLQPSFEVWEPKSYSGQS